MYLALVELQAPPAARFVEMKFSALVDARRWARRQAATLKGCTGQAAVFNVDGPLVTLAWELRADAQSGLASCNVDLPASDDGVDAAFAQPKFPVRGLYVHDRQ